MHEIPEGTENVKPDARPARKSVVVWTILMLLAVVVFELTAHSRDWLRSYSAVSSPGKTVSLPCGCCEAILNGVAAGLVSRFAWRLVRD